MCTVKTGLLAFRVFCSWWQISHLIISVLWLGLLFAWLSGRKFEFLSYQCSSNIATHIHCSALNIPHNLKYKQCKLSMSACGGVFNHIQECLQIHGEYLPMDWGHTVHTRGPYLVLHADTWHCTIPNESRDDWNSPSDKHAICHVAQRPCCQLWFSSGALSSSVRSVRISSFTE